MKDFLEFYEGMYFKEGILNAYIRVLDVYNELCIAEVNHKNPEIQLPKIKIFETNILGKKKLLNSTKISKFS